MGLYKILRIIALVLALIGVVFALMVAGSDKETLMQDGSMVDNMMRIAYLVFAIVLVLVLVYVLKGLFTGNIKKTLLTLGIFFVIVIIAYSVSSGSDLDLQPFIDKGQNITEATSKKVGAGLYIFYTLAILAILSMLSSGLIKKTR